MDGQFDQEGVNKAFNAAVISGDVENARHLLKKGADVNYCSNRTQFPLHVAVRRGNLAMVELLIEYKSKLSADDPYSENALFIAISKGHPEIVEALLKYGAEPNERTNFNRTPLMMAVTAKLPDEKLSKGLRIANLLLEYGADLSLVNDDGDTVMAITEKQARGGHEPSGRFVELFNSNIQSKVLEAQINVDHSEDEQIRF